MALLQSPVSLERLMPWSSEEELEIGGEEIWKKCALGLRMASGSGGGEASGIYSGRTEIRATVRSRDFRHASRIEPL